MRHSIPSAFFTTLYYMYMFMTNLAIPLLDELSYCRMSCPIAGYAVQLLNMIPYTCIVEAPMESV